MHLIWTGFVQCVSLGLDPALPLFATTNRNRKLDASDAKFVDVIHSNAGVLGKIEPSGHLDFYLNGGQLQPACNGHRSELFEVHSLLFVIENCQFLS